MKWSRLVKSANLWRQRERIRLNHLTQQSWSFHCQKLQWCGYEVIPLDTPLALFDEAMAMGTCLYSLRSLCCKSSFPSRFFSLRNKGQRVATFELTYDGLKTCSKQGRSRKAHWKLQDARLSFNRLISKKLTADLLVFAEMYSNWANGASRALTSKINQCS